MATFRKLGYNLVASSVLIFAFITQANAQFETRGTSVFGDFPISAAVGDFNHDGRLDIAVAQNSSNTGYGADVLVLLGNGDGTFKAPVSYSVGLAPSSIAAADLNKDGNLDLVVVNAISDTVSILLGKGDGTFQPAMNFATPQGPIFVTVADFNGDGKLDLATVNRSDLTGYCDCIAIFLGNGDGTFQPPSLITSLPDIIPYALAVADFNRDGKLDLAVTQEFGGTSEIQIFPGNGDGTFQVGPAYAVGPGPTSIAVADFNGDHKVDLAVAENGGIGVGVFMGNGDGTLQPRVDYRTNFPHWVAAADFNSDGKKDLVVANLDFPSGVTVLRGNGDGSFQPGVYYADGGEERFVTIGDFNGDHKIDILALDYAGGAIVMLNTGVVTFSPNTPLAFGNQLVGATSAPLSVTLTNTGATALTISSMTASSQFGVSSTCGASVAPGAHCNVNAIFSPLTKGAFSGTVSIRDSASSKPQVIEVSGSGTVVQLSPTTLTFPPQKVGTKSAPQNIQLTNTGSTTLTFSQIGLTKGNFDYAQTNNCVYFLQGHATCTIAVIFQPTKTGTRTANVIVSDNGGGSPQKVFLTGTGN